MDLNTKAAWDILRDDEKTSLSLSLGHGKSSWESGEIMGRAHFKYLEIQKRATKFLEIFTNHFEKYGELIPPNIVLPFNFKEYLHLTMVERKNISESVRQMESSGYLIASSRTRLITKELEYLKISEKESAYDLYNLIMDFDRWNNFRILPTDLQEPSAYKRRNKNRNKKHIKNITTLPKFSVLKLVEKYHYSGKYGKLYLPIVSKFVDGNLMIVPVKDNTNRINKITKIGLFLFKEQSDAYDFGSLIHKYFFSETRTCISGQKFWPKFRELMDKSLNKDGLENIHKSRTYLDNAIFTKSETEWLKEEKTGIK